MTLNQCTIWASGHYLTKHFPVYWALMSDEDLFLFIEKHRWAPFKSYSVKQVAEFIHEMATEVESWLKENNHGS